MNFYKQGDPFPRLTDVPVFSQVIRIYANSVRWGKKTHPETLRFIETSQSQARLCVRCNATCSFVVQLIGARLLSGFSVFTWPWLSVIPCFHVLTKRQVHCLCVRIES